MKRWDVWRRLPGVQGQNDCWGREGTVDAEDARTAVAVVAATFPGHFHPAECFAVRTDCVSEVFWTRRHVKTEQSISVLDKDEALRA